MNNIKIFFDNNCDEPWEASIIIEVENTGTLCSTKTKLVVTGETEIEARNKLSEQLSRYKIRGEFFTPQHLVNEMLDKLPLHIWADPDKTFIDNSSGDGNFLIEVKNRLLAQGFLEVNILENQIFAVEINIDSVLQLQERLGYTIDGQPNPLLNLDNFKEEELHEECIKFCLGHAGTRYLHHRNIVCYPGLEYDYEFGRKKMMIEFDRVGTFDDRSGIQDLFKSLNQREKLGHIDQSKKDIEEFLKPKTTLLQLIDNKDGFSVYYRYDEDGSTYKGSVSFNSYFPPQVEFLAPKLRS